MLGEGDVLRALGASAYCLQYSQDPRLELDFRVESLATDLRSGVRLCRCIELLSGGQPHRLGVAQLSTDEISTGHEAK